MRGKRVCGHRRARRPAALSSLGRNCQYNITNKTTNHTQKQSGKKPPFPSYVFESDCPKTDCCMKMQAAHYKYNKIYQISSPIE